MALPYTTRFIDTLGGRGSYSYQCPAGMTAVVRDVSMFVKGLTGPATLYLFSVAGGVIFAGSGGTTDDYFAHLETRYVFRDLETITAEAILGDPGVIVCGYLFTGV